MVDESQQSVQENLLEPRVVWEQFTESIYRAYGLNFRKVGTPDLTACPTYLLNELIYRHQEALGRMPDTSFAGDETYFLAKILSVATSPRIYIRPDGSFDTTDPKTHEPENSLGASTRGGLGSRNRKVILASSDNSICIPPLQMLDVRYISQLTAHAPSEIVPLDIDSLRIPNIPTGARAFFLGNNKRIEWLVLSHRLPPDEYTDYSKFIGLPNIIRIEALLDNECDFKQVVEQLRSARSASSKITKRVRNAREENIRRKRIDAEITTLKSKAVVRELCEQNGDAFLYVVNPDNEEKFFESGYANHQDMWERNEDCKAIALFFSEVRAHNRTISSWYACCEPMEIEPTLIHVAGIPVPILVNQDLINIPEGMFFAKRSCLGVEIVFDPRDEKLHCVPLVGYKLDEKDDLHSVGAFLSLGYLRNIGVILED